MDNRTITATLSAVNDQSVSLLQLSTRAETALRRSSIHTVDQLRFLAHAQERLPTSAAIVQEIEAALSTLDGVMDSNGNVDWLKYWSLRGIELLPLSYQGDWSTSGVIDVLPRIIEQVLNQADDRAWPIIKHRYSLDEASKLTLDDLGGMFGISRERIRQIEKKGLTELQATLIGHRFAGKPYRIRPEYSLAVSGLYELTSIPADELRSQQALLESLGDAMGVSAERHAPLMSLLLETAGYRCCEFDDPGLRPVWGKLARSEQSKFERAIMRIHSCLTHETAVALPEVDLLTRINKNQRSSDRVTLEQFRWLVDCCTTVERLEDNTIRGRFEFLRSRGNQVERVLTEVGRPLHFTQIARMINHRLVQSGQSKVEQLNLKNQMIRDGRFEPIGRSGEWGLKSWSHIDKGTIVESIETYLMSRDCSATVEEIYMAVRARRPVSRQSVVTYLNTDNRFRKLGRAQWGLSSWKKGDDTRTWDPPQVAEFVAGLFRQKRVRELKYRDIKEALMLEADITAREAQGLLNWNPVIQTHRKQKWGEVYATFQPNYKEGLANPTQLRKRKKVTLRDRIDQSTRSILESMPGKQIALSDLVSLLQKQHGCPTKTVYQYVAHLDYVERIESLDSPGKICQMKTTSGAAKYPQVATINNIELRHNIERAIAHLHLEAVDIGLFLLSKEFEASLKKYLLAAMDAGLLAKVPNLPPDKWKLVNMVDCARDNGLISDGPTFHYLRQMRNDRAHGPTPDLEERRTLMDGIEVVAGLYINYIKLLEERYIDIARGSRGQV